MMARVPRDQARDHVHGLHFTFVVFAEAFDTLMI